MIAALLLLLIVQDAFAAVSAVDTTAYVSQTPGTAPDGQSTYTLYNALAKHDIQKIILTGDYHAGDEFRALQGSPLPISRNVTITSLPGQWFTLDLNFAHLVVELCANCTFTLLANLTLANARRGTNPTVDFFVGKPGSRLLLDGIYRHRLACTETKEAFETLDLLQRSKLLPGASQQQGIHVADVMYQGKMYPNSVEYVNVTVDIPYTHDEGRGFSGGYALGTYHSVRLCEHYVDKACLQKESPDACINELINQLEAGATQQGAGLSSGALAAAIAVPVVVAVLLVAGILLYMRRRKQQQQDSSGKCFSDLEGAKSGISSRGKHDPTSVSGSSCGSLAQPKGSEQGWELQSSVTSPFLGDIDREEADGPVRLGEFIGAGSFGRVYCGKWAGRDVAIKVIEHSHDNAQAVLNEMHLMMAFNSPYVVRAYKCLTYCRTGVDGSSCGEYSSMASMDTCGGLPLAPVPSTAAATAGSSNSLMRNGSSSWHPAAASGPSGLNSQPNNSNAGSSSSPGAAAPLVKAGSFNPKTPDNTPVTAAAAVGGTGCTPNHDSGGFIYSTGKSSRNSNPKQHERGNPLATWLVQEYCDEGTLKAYATRNELPARLLESNEAMLVLLMLLRDTAQGLAALHAQAVVHGDLNSRNVLVGSDPKAEAHVRAKIADLGISKAIAQHKTHRTTSCLGTITHSAPELLRSGRMAPQIDVYSFGVMMWELYTGQEAFGKLMYGQFYETVVVNDMRPSVPEGMPSDYETLMEHCWATDLAERPNVKQLIQCLQYMIDIRKQPLAAAATGEADGSSEIKDTAAEAAAAAQPMPELLRLPARRQQARQRKQQKLKESERATSAAAAAAVQGNANEDRLLILDPESPTAAAAAAEQGAPQAAAADVTSGPLTPVSDAAVSAVNKFNTRPGGTSWPGGHIVGDNSSKPHSGTLGSIAEPTALPGSPDSTRDLPSAQAAHGLKETLTLSTYQAADASNGPWFV